MKSLLAAVIFAFASTGLAQSGHDSHHKMDEAAKKQSASDTHRASGVVTRVDAAAGKVTIRHEPVASLNWPGMTMAFRLKDKKMIDTLKPGAKVDFDFQQQGKDYVINRIR